MARLAIAKAAKLLSIDRSELQQMVQQGRLTAFDGMVDFEEICRCYPSLLLNRDGGANERARLIRATAFGRRVRDTLAPDPAELEVKLRQRETDLSIYREQARHYQSLLNDLLKQLGRLQLNATPEQRPIIDQLNQWLTSRMG